MFAPLRSQPDGRFQLRANSEPDFFITQSGGKLHGQRQTALASLAHFPIEAGSVEKDNFDFLDDLFLAQPVALSRQVL